MESFNKIANFLSGACSEQDVAELEAWRKAAPANEEEFRKFEKIWNAPSHASSFNPDVSKAWAKVSACVFKEEKEKVATSEKANSRSFFLLKSYWKIAAAVSLLLLAGFVYFLMSPSLTPTPYDGLAKLETNAYERKEVILPDGTQLWLNENSSLYYPEEFSANERLVHLVGEAYFEVESIPGKTFIIKAGTGEIKVLGTEFNVETRSKEKTKLQVVKGRVLFSSTANPASSVVVNGGEAAEIQGQEVKPLRQNKNFLSWKTGEFIFENANLGEVLKTLESYYSVSFKATDHNLLNCRLSARFRQQSIEEILNVLDITLNLAHSYSKDKKEITLTPTGKGPHCAGINN